MRPWKPYFIEHHGVEDSKGKKRIPTAKEIYERKQKNPDYTHPWFEAKGEYPEYTPPAKDKPPMSWEELQQQKKFWSGEQSKEEYKARLMGGSSSTQAAQGVGQGVDLSGKFGIDPKREVFNELTGFDPTEEERGQLSRMKEDQLIPYLEAKGIDPKFLQDRGAIPYGEMAEPGEFLVGGSEWGDPSFREDILSGAFEQEWYPYGDPAQAQAQDPVEYAKGGTYLEDVSAIQREWDMIVSGMEPSNMAFAYGDPMSRYQDPYVEKGSIPHKGYGLEYVGKGGGAIGTAVGGYDSSYSPPSGAGGGGNGGGLLGGGIGADLFEEADEPHVGDVVQYGAPEFWRPLASSYAINTPDQFGDITQQETVDPLAGTSGGYVPRDVEEVPPYMEDIQMAKYGMRKRRYPYGGKY